MADLSVSNLLRRWPARSDILADARAENAALDLVAVHRWFARGAVPGRYWWALAQGAARRGITCTTDDLARAHACPKLRVA